MKHVSIDSQLKAEEILKQNPHFPSPIDIINQLTILEVVYYSFDKVIHKGQIVINKALVTDIQGLFALILAQKFPLTSVIPIADTRFHWDDELSMQANNTSGFNYAK